MTPLAITADTRDARNAISSLEDRLARGARTWLDEFRSYLNTRTTETFDALAQGGSFRGVTWPPFKKLPGPRRGGASARLLDFTGALKREASSGAMIEDDRIEWRMTLPYAAKQQARRPFLFFEIPTDIDRAREIAQKFLTE